MCSKFYKIKSSKNTGPNYNNNVKVLPNSRCVAPTRSRSGQKWKTIRPFDGTVHTNNLNKTREIKFRPIHEEGINKMSEWLKTETWEQVFNEPCANLKAECLQNTLLSKVDEYFPQKSRIISCNDQPFFSYKLKNLKRKKAREYNKHRKSIKYKKLEELYQQELSKSKRSFYQKQISRLRKSKPGKWYLELKTLTNYDQFQTEK